MPKFRLQVLQNKVLGGIDVFRQDDSKNVFPRTVDALFDTGATATCITSSLAEDLGLEANGKVNVKGIHGAPVPRNVYKCTLGIPCHKNKNGTTIYIDRIIDVDELPHGNILIGMDIINKGALYLKGDSGMFGYDSGICDACGCCEEWKALFVLLGNCKSCANK